MLEDGTYDALVFDADDAPGGGAIVELTILAGEHRGATLSITARDHVGDPLDLLGIPATLTVRDGQPSIVFEP